MNYKFGDKVLVTLTIRRVDPDDRQKLQYEGVIEDEETLRSIWVKDLEIRPWTERPTPPVTVLWTPPNMGCEVLSDGSVRALPGCGTLTDAGVSAMLAAYVRHLQEGK